ncbi:mycothiol transferase [Cellulomonas edaphi]|uniref:DUF664 domain-containing protein n=1 Tax=Cellulomonas edaphi TaxID=3053468 RepID=A0ABT7S6S1_9CELL|nr:DinB family protein [Cellulomons edaphi]MDM7831312.1 DUF664 domain-containing protein [Cellulomons edaphi]
MDALETLLEAFGRVAPGVHRVVDGLDDAALEWRPDPRANTLGWLAWHIARGEDAQVAPLAGTEQVWTAGGWARRFALPFDDAESGYGQDADSVAAVKVSGALLLGYLDDVAAATRRYLGTLTDADLDRVVDTSWDPPVTLGVRLVSVVGDGLQHLGQAGYVRGLYERR